MVNPASVLRPVLLVRAVYLPRDSFAYNGEEKYQFDGTEKLNVPTLVIKSRF